MSCSPPFVALDCKFCDLTFRPFDPILYTMTIEPGSMNVSVVPGTYVYPVQRYNTEPVEAAPAVQPRPYKLEHPEEEEAKPDESAKATNYGTSVKRDLGRYVDVAA